MTATHTEVSPPSQSHVSYPQPPVTPKKLATRGMRIEPPQQSSILPQNAGGVESLRSRMRNTTVFSPVNQNGSFDFDRVIKSGDVLKRTRKTKTWKQYHLVLRPTVLSLYKDPEETKLRHQLPLTDLTAVARQRDPKGKVAHVFGLFSPSRNFHLAVGSEKEAQSWVETIRSEARMDEEEEELILMSPGGNGQTAFSGFGRAGAVPLSSRKENVLNSSEEDIATARLPYRPPQQRMHSSSVSSAGGAPVTAPRAIYNGPTGTRRPSNNLAYSGNEHGSFSDFSDSAFGPSMRESSVSLSNAHTNVEAAKVYGLDTSSVAPRSRQQNASTVSGFGESGAERVVTQGWLYVLKSKGGVRSWKKVWTVLRGKGLAMYKNEEEYSPILILPTPTILDIVELDPISKSKRYCLQLISEERSYRFCAPDEDALARWLGSIKCVLTRRKEQEKERKGEKDTISPATAKTTAPIAGLTNDAGRKQSTENAPPPGRRSHGES